MCKDIFELRKEHHYRMIDKKMMCMILLHIFYGEFFDEKSMPESAKKSGFVLNGI